MRLLVGLGNPGEKHLNNRHNIGFMAADKIRETYDFSPYRRCLLYTSDAADE